MNVRRETIDDSLPFKNQAAIQLLKGWLSDTSDYDKIHWPLLKQAIEAQKLSKRERFDD